MAHPGNYDRVQEKVAVRAKRKATAEEKAVIGRNQLKRMLLGMGSYATTKLQPNGKAYRRAAGRKFVRSQLAEV